MSSETPVLTAGHQCYHCKQWIETGAAHDCWTTTESALTQDLSEDLLDAWERLRETAAAFGEQRIYASHHSIMFSRKSCYFFVRPKKNCLEVCIFLDRPIRAPQVKRAERPSRTKVANIVRITHRDEVEAPFTDWLREAYDLPDRLAAAKAAAGGAGIASRSSARRSNLAKKATGRKTARKSTGSAGGAKKGGAKKGGAKKGGARKGSASKKR